MSKPWAPLEKERKKTLKKRYVGVAASAHAADAPAAGTCHSASTDPQLPRHTHVLNEHTHDLQQ